MTSPALWLDPRIRFISLLVSGALIFSTFFPAAFWKFGAFLLCILAVFWLISPNKTRSFRNFLKLSLVLIPLILFLAAVVFIFSAEAFKNRLENFLDLTTKTFLILASTFVFIIDSNFGDFIRGFYLWRLPSGFLAMITFAYRYFILIREELLSVFRARISRTINRRPLFKELKITGLILNQYLLRLVERSEKIYAALLSRGFQGRLDFLVSLKLRKSDYFFLFLFNSIVMAIKFL
ncbi:MAG: energy-coupling factor transporter transmembrane component T family protein [Candidatus Saccharicenans sp.]